MSQVWQQRERARDLLSKEVGYVRKPHGGKLRIALAFPNTYFVGMSNLGFQTVYKLFNAEEAIVCERVFLPPKTELAAQLASGAPLVTLESQTPVGEFDIFAFSVSFEWDYTNVLTLLRLAGIPRRAAERTAHDPLVMIGGAVTFVNPEPLALFADIVSAGEGEALIPSLVRAFTRRERSRRPAAAARSGTRLLRAGLLRRAVRGGRHHRGIRPARGYRRTAGRPEGGAEDDRGGGSAGDDDLHAGHRVRLALPRRSRSRLREPVPLLLGGIQLPSGPRVSEGAHPAAGRAGQTALEPRRPGVDRAVRSPRHRGDPDASGRDGLRHQPGVAAARRHHADHPSSAAAERREDDHDCPRNRIGSAPPRHQQDADQRRDPRARRDDLRGRHGEPEAVLHDRHPDRDRRGPRRHSRSDAAAARDHAEARARRAATSGASSAA